MNTPSTLSVVSKYHFCFFKPELLEKTFFFKDETDSKSEVGNMNLEHLVSKSK